MKVGFSGTRKGMTQIQNAKMRQLLDGLVEFTEAHHGDCIGADSEFHWFCLVSKIKVVIHPPDVDRYRSHCTAADVVLGTKPYLERNQDIVDAVDLLIACPQESKSNSRSGTWATIRYAQQQQKPIFVIFTDGEVRPINIGLDQWEKTNG